MNGIPSIWGLRLLAVVLAVVAWFFISFDQRERESQKTIESSVTYNTPRDVLVLDPVQRVQVRLRGDTSDIRKLNPFLVDVLVDVPADAGEQVDVHLGAENVIMPEGLEVVSIEPNILRLRLDEVISRMLPVEPRLVGEPAAGAVAGNVETIPDRVVVSGPSTRLEEMEAVTTTPVRLDGHAFNFDEQAMVVSPDPLVNVVGPAVVTVRVPLRIPPTGAREGGRDEKAGAGDD